MQPNHEYVSKQPVPHEKVGCPSRNMAFCTRYSYSLLIVACLENEYSRECLLTSTRTSTE